jgi:hypothetical protein
VVSDKWFYLTPFIPLSVDGEGEIFKRGLAPLFYLLPLSNPLAIESGIMCAVGKGEKGG